MTSTPITGIHHVTAFAKDVQANHDFYAGLLGLRLIKVTINFDDPSMYHTYFADYSGTPGTVLTFFPIPNAAPGRVGPGQITATAYAVPTGGLTFWQDRLAAEGVSVSEVFERFGDRLIAFPDPDGMVVEIVEPAEPEQRAGWTGGPISPEFTLRGIHAVTYSSLHAEASRRLLVEGLGFEMIAAEGGRERYRAAGGGPDSLVDLLDGSGQREGRMGAGTVHHLAFRVADAAAQGSAMDRLRAAGTLTTEVKNRDYFRSIYFREPGGSVMEIATEGPGFAIDEPLEELGGRLCLPGWLEDRRESVRARLPELRLPSGVVLP
ncbi:MAG: ring-cleaving dioxygenase [Fimbriimonadaceae bacterium]|nr:ring-cleaving dioxygenase [Fimbriimonadaceae bacterium]